MDKYKVSDKDLRYAAYKRCPCGAGLAYVPSWYDDQKSPAYRCWDCSYILLGGEPIVGVTHTAQLPFIFYEIVGEEQPSVHGSTTRPKVQ